MCVLNGSQFHWTKETEEFFVNDGEMASQNAYDKQRLQILDMVNLVQSGTLSKPNKMKVGALCVVDVHARDVMLKLAPDARMRKLKSSGAGRHPALPDRPTDKDLSAHYRATWLPEFKAADRKDRRHFDARAHEEYAGTRHAPAAGSKPWVDNGHHFLLQGLPQVGKTGAFLWLSWRLWREVAELAAGRGAAAEWPEDEVHASELQNDSEEELDEPGPVDVRLTRKYPVFAEVRRINFKDAPRAGKYGDPSEDSPMY